MTTAVEALVEMTAFAPRTDLDRPGCSPPDTREPEEAGLRHKNPSGWIDFRQSRLGVSPANRALRVFGPTGMKYRGGSEAGLGDAAARMALAEIAANAGHALVT